MAHNTFVVSGNCGADTFKISPNNRGAQISHGDVGLFVSLDYVAEMVAKGERFLVDMGYRALVQARDVEFEVLADDDDSILVPVQLDRNRK